MNYVTFQLIISGIFQWILFHYSSFSRYIMVIDPSFEYNILICI